MADLHAFGRREDAAAALAEAVLHRLATGLSARGAATLVVPGGTSPAALFACLRCADLDWSRVTVVPSDERWVPVTDPESNERLLRETLCIDAASDARLLGLYRDTPTPRAALDEVAAALDALPTVVDAVVLGMGADGHTASLFPDARNIAACLETSAPCVAPQRPPGETPRLSLSLARLRATKSLSLLCFGEDKRAAYTRAAEPGPSTQYPVRGVIHQSRVPLSVYWAD